MKKNAIVAFAGTLVIAAFAFSGISFKSSSLEDLKANAANTCKYNSGSFCPSDDGDDVLTDYIVE